MKRFIGPLVVFLFLSGVILYAWPAATISYGVLVLAHAAAGIAALVAIVLLGRAWFAAASRGAASSAAAAGPPAGDVASRWGWLLIFIGGLAGAVLLWTGTPRGLAWLLWIHIALSAAGVVLLVEARARRGGWMAGMAAPARLAAVLAMLAVVAGLSWWTREVRWARNYRIENPLLPPATMEGEGDGPRGPFWPSSAQTRHGGLIPSKFFMQSDACERCHTDIYNQWNASAHRFSSFNNQWYRKSIEYMQEVAGVQGSKWCAGCHDPALLFSGMFETPIKEQMDAPEAHAGLGCVMCHSIVEVKSTMGQGDYVLEYPRLSQLAASENKYVRQLHDFLVRLNPEPHRRTFMKPFVRQQTAEFCSTCHKVHLDVPVNNYRWVRGFNEYDNWQASGVSGQGARSFYYPEKPQKCVDCHMPMVASNDDGNLGGYVHSHRFPGANSALPFANRDDEQMRVTRAFLENNIVTVDLFAVSAAPPAAAAGEFRGQELSTAFAVGEEAEAAIPTGVHREPAPVTAPLDRVEAVVRRGDEVRVDVVVRTRTVGHFFPGGTVDAFDVWVELQAVDARGRVVFWSGMVEDEGRGPVEPGAHFYRSLMVDARGNPINKRNAWANRAVVYVRLIPPGAADTVHYRLRVPEDAGDEITLRAALHYRKFMWWNTQFSFAGERDPADPSPDVTPHYDDGRWVFTGDTSKVSGKRKEIPDLPVITIARDEAKLRVAPRNTPAPEPRVELRAEDWSRWNDYGIGLFLQGDLAGAEAAFTRVTEIAPGNPDGWVNIGRVRVQEGNLEGAREVLRRALELSPQLARAHYFYARVLRAEGDYEEAARHLEIVLAQYPKDRVVRNDLGRIRFLQRRYADAVREFEQTLRIDPEDLQAHYNLMLAYNGLGDVARAEEHKARYLRFKADESAQAITGPYRLQHPHDNNERQAIHEHASAPLDRRPRPRPAARDAGGLD